MDSTIIDLHTYKEQQAGVRPSSEASMSPELINEIQILIQRLRDSNPIKQPGQILG